MSTYRIKDKNYPWPNEGENNWGETVTDYIFALTNAVNEIFSKTVLNNTDQEITGQKTFKTIPRISVDSQGNGYYRNYYLAYTQQPTNIDTLINDLKSKLNQVRAFIDPASYSTLLPESLAEPILELSRYKDHSIRNYLEGIIKLTNQLTPIGSIKAVYQTLEDSVLAKWIPATEDDNDAIFLEQAIIDEKKVNIYDQSIIDGETQGYYKLTGGNWALCDYRFPLPLHFGNSGSKILGAIEYLSPKFIPNLIEDAFLKGSSLTSDIEVTGSNFTTLEVDQLPSHSHDVSHSTQTEDGGIHKHVYSRRNFNVSNLQSVVTDNGNNYFIKQFNTSSTNLNTSSTGEHVHDLNLNFTTQQTGTGKSIDKTPKHLPVKYYMRVL